MLRHVVELLITVVSISILNGFFRTGRGPSRRAIRQKRAEIVSLETAPRRRMLPR